MQNFKIIGLTAIVFNLLTANPSMAAQDYALTIGYDIYTGGLHTMSATMGIDLDQKDYTIDMIAKPHGAIGKLLPWKGKYQSTGLVKDNTLQPKRHSKSSSWSDETDRTVLEYNAQGTLVEAKREEFKDGETVRAYDHTITPELVHDTVDLMTATVTMLRQAGSDKGCDTSLPVFDGKRRFNMVFKQQATPTLTASRLNKFDGETLKCTVEIVPVAGWEKRKRGYYKIQEASREKGYLPTVWLGQAYEGGPMIPVRMEIKSDYGAILMHFQNTLVEDQTTASND